MDIKRKFRKIAEDINYGIPVADDICTDEREKISQQIVNAMLSAYALGKNETIVDHISDDNKKTSPIPTYEVNVYEPTRGGVLYRIIDRAEGNQIIGKFFNREKAEKCVRAVNAYDILKFEIDVKDSIIKKLKAKNRANSVKK